MWLGQSNKTGEYLAMKQFPKQNGEYDSSAVIEIQIQKVIFKKLDNEVGRENIARLVDWVEEKKDLWLIYELCEGKNMNEGLFEVKGEFYKGERIY